MTVNLYGPSGPGTDILQLILDLTAAVKSIQGGFFIAPGAVTDEKVAADAAIAQSKIADLIADLAARATDAELAAEAGLRAAGDTAQATSLGNHLTDTVDAHDASAVSVVPAGALAATNAQAALTELDADITAEATARATGDNSRLPLAGGTLTGALVLAGDAAAALQAVPKQQLDAAVASGVPDASATVKGKVQLAGDLAGTAAAPTVPGLATEATARAAGDAAAVQRVNHTGTQLAATISDLTEATQDAVGGALTDTATLDLTYNDAGGTISGTVLDSPTVAGATAAQLRDRSTHTGAQAESTVTNLVADLASKLPLAGGTLTGALVLAADAAAALQAVPKQQLDAAVAAATIPDATTTVKGKVQLAGDLGGTAALPTVPGLANKADAAATTAALATKATDFAPSVVGSVQAASTVNVASLSAPQTVDGVALIAGNRVLLTAQTTASQNGPWVVAAGAWTRPADYAAASTQQPGTHVHVLANGTANANTDWLLTNASAVTVDTTAATWVKSYVARHTGHRRFLGNVEFKGGGITGALDNIDGNALTIFAQGDPIGAGVPTGYFNNGGHFHTQRGIVCSGATSPSAGAGYNTIWEPALEGAMIAAWSDLGATEASYVARSNFFRGPLFKGRTHYADRTFEIGHDGSIGWAPYAETGTKYAEQANPANDLPIDIRLSRAATAALQVIGASADFRINATTGNPQLQLMRNGVSAFSLNGTIGPTVYAELAGVTTWRMYQGRVAIGGADESGGILSVVGNNSATPVLRVKRVVSQSVDIVRVLDEADAILSRLDKGGRFGTRVNTAPADADVATSEAMLWFDNTNGAAKLMVKAKQADGTVRSGSVVLS